jgi:SSS family solute:Na+ symporter
VCFIDLALPWIFFAVTNPQVLQRLFIPKDKKAFSWMVWMFALFGLLYTLVVSFLGFSARSGTTHGLFPAVTDRDRVILGLLAGATAAVVLVEKPRARKAGDRRGQS